MNTEWALAKLAEMITISERYSARSSTEQDVQTQALMLQKWPAVKQILAQLGLAAVTAPGADQWIYEVRRLCHQATGALRDQDEVEANLGDPSPTVHLSGLHPWVWDAAGTYWGASSHRVAVAVAAAEVNTRVQAKVGRFDIADDALIAQVFSDDPPSPGKARLRLPEVDTDATQQSRQRGARALGQGCFWALRNPATHRTEEWPEQLAVEALATLSVLARLIDEADVVTT